MPAITATAVTSIKALRRNPLRSALTTLGIIIGIASVIAMVQIGEGSSAAIKQTIKNMGANTLIIFPRCRRQRGGEFWGRQCRDTDIRRRCGYCP